MSDRRGAWGGEGESFRERGSVAVCGAVGKRWGGSLSGSVMPCLIHSIRCIVSTNSYELSRPSLS